MTALAKLPEKWREQADYELRQSQDKIWAEWVRDRHLACGSAFNRCADELEAALSPAELGGVENPDRYALRMLVAAGWVSESKANEALNIAHGFAKEPLSTPRAAEAVTEEMVRIALDAYAKEHAEHDDRLPACVRTMNSMRAALTASLTPPSAKGE